MALKSQTKPHRVAIPHEEGEWIEILPPSAGDLRDIKDLESHDYNLALAEKMITAWSYSEPLTLANLTDLDSITYRWLTNDALPAHMNARPEEEKKDSLYSSPDGRAPALASSRRSSPT